MSEDSEVKVSSSGYVDMKIGKGAWKVGYATLVGGSLFYYKLITVCISFFLTIIILTI
jgi:hypothetical protein